MLRTALVLIAWTLVSLATDIRAQQFPAPYLTLHDAKHKITAPPPPAEGKYQEVDGRRFVRIDPSPTRIWVLAFSQDGKFLAAGKDYGRIVIWDVAKKSVYSVVEAGTGSIVRVAISPDDQYVAATVMGIYQLMIWHIPDGKKVNSLAPSSMIGNVLFSRDPSLLIYAYSAKVGPDTSGFTHFVPTVDVVNPLTGAQVASFSSESSPILSADGANLMTESANNIVLRSTTDWKEQKRLPRLTHFAHPVFLDLTRGWYLFSDGTDDHRVVVARLDDGQMPQDVHLANLPNFSHYIPPFAEIEPKTGLVFGHGNGQLWVLNLKTGQTCFSPNLLSDGAAISPNGDIVASAFDSPASTDDQDEAGVGIWKTESIAQSCRLK
jgi:WD40 repeat protein